MSQLKTSTLLFIGLMACGLLLPRVIYAATASPGARAAIDGFHAALKRGDGKAALLLLSEDALIYESGYAESKSEYTAHHLASDIEFASSTTRIVKASASRCNQVTCLITEQTETNGTFKGKTVKSYGVETTVLEQKNGVWQIVHVHWSSHK